MADLTERPADFDAYWDAVDRELERYPAAAELEHLPRHSDEYSNVYAVRLTSIGPYRIFGYLSVPVGAGPFPGLLITPRYGSVNHLPHLDDRQRYVVMIAMHRGQRLADKPFAATYPGLLTLGIDDPATYIYRGIVADCLRAAEFLLARPEVDTMRVGVMGDDLALITAARRPRFRAVQASGLMFYRLGEAHRRSEAYPVEEVNDYLRTYPERSGAVACTITYLDPRHHGTARAVSVLLSVAGGALGSQEWLQPLADTLGGSVQHYTLTHEGGTDHDWLDAWLADQLGATAKPRLWDVA